MRLLVNLSPYPRVLFLPLKRFQIKKSSLRPYKKITNPTRAARNSTCRPYKKISNPKKSTWLAPIKRLPHLVGLPCPASALPCSLIREESIRPLHRSLMVTVITALQPKMILQCFARCTVNIGQVQGN